MATDYGAIGQCYFRSTQQSLGLPERADQQPAAQFHSWYKPLALWGENKYPQNGYIAGHLYADQAKTSPVANQAIGLFYRKTLELIRRTYTASDGSFRFDQLYNEDDAYLLVTIDATGAINAVRVDRLTPGTYS